MKAGSSHSIAATRGRGASATAWLTASMRRRACSRNSRDSGSLRSRPRDGERRRAPRQASSDRARRRGACWTASRNGHDIVIRHCADVANRLGDDQLRVELREPPGIQLIQRAPGGDRSRTVQMISAADRPAGTTVRVRWGREAASVASRLVRDRDDLISEPEREQEAFGRARDQGRDPHAPKLPQRLARVTATACTARSRIAVGPIAVPGGGVALRRRSSRRRKDAVVPVVVGHVALDPGAGRLLRIPVSPLLFAVLPRRWRAHR